MPKAPFFFSKSVLLVRIWLRPLLRSVLTLNDPLGVCALKMSERRKSVFEPEHQRNVYALKSSQIIGLIRHLGKFKGSYEAMTGGFRKVLSLLPHMF